jgi:hypothetical protein
VTHDEGTFPPEIGHVLDSVGDSDGGDHGGVVGGDCVDGGGVRAAGMTYEKCSIYRTSEWVVWDPNKRMLHLFDDGQGAIKFFNDGMVVREAD